MGPETTARKPTAATEPAEEKFWTVGNLKWLVGTATLPVVLLLLSTHYQEQSKQNAQEAIRAADERAKADRNLQLYTELLQRRESADTEARRDVFNKLMDKYLNPADTDLDGKAVLLEVLALNFHESLNLSPLFWQLDRKIHRAKLEAKTRDELLSGLERVALEVKNRQVAFLAPNDLPQPHAVELANVPVLGLKGTCEAPSSQGSGTVQHAVVVNVESSYQDAQAKADNHKRGFSIDVICRDPLERRLRVQVTDKQSRRVWDPFWLDLYDFPLVNFTRLSGAERFSIVLDAYDAKNGFAQLRLVYFPNMRGGAKDKAYITDLMSRLLPDELSPGAAAPAGAASVPR